LICHGQGDKVVKLRFSQSAAKCLAKKGYKVIFKSYPELDHAVEPKELQDIRDFISQQLPSNQSNNSKL
jgi:predicted esterase